MTIQLPTLKDAGNLRGKRVLLRLNLDLPVENGELRDTHRIDSADKTIRYLQEQGAKTLIIGHTGRDPKETLRPAFDYLKQSFPIQFADTPAGAKVEMASLAEGSFLLLDTSRFYMNRHRVS